MIALLLAAILAAGGNFDRAERAYRAGRYAEAMTLYEAALSEADTPQAPVLYNLGNCAFRLGRHAEAVLLYRRAQLRMPGDAQVEFNLRLAERQLGIEPPPADPVGALIAARVESLTAGQVLALTLLLQTGGLAGLVLLRRRGTARNLLALLVVIGLLGDVRLVGERWFAGPPEGVVLVREISLRSEPHPSLGITLRLAAGETVLYP